MLTQDQLTAIRTRLNYARNHTDDTLQMCQDILSLLTEVGHLQAHNKQMQSALTQFSDKECWSYIEGDKGERQLPGLYMWELDVDPIDLAEHALIHE